MFTTLMYRLLRHTRAEIRLKVIQDLFSARPTVHRGAICFVICTQTSVSVCLCVCVYDRLRL